MRANEFIRGTKEDYDPNGPPPGPESKPTMPAGTVRVDVSDVYDWYKLGQHISNMKGLGHHDFGKGPPSTIVSFGSEDEEHKYIKDLEKLGLSTTDIDPADPNQPRGMKRQKTDPTYNVDEADEPENPGRRGFLKKLGAAGVAAAMPGTAMRALAAPAVAAWPATAAVNIGLNGLTVLSAYGFFFDIPRLDAQSKDEYLRAWPELFEEIPQVLNRPGGFWDNVYKLPVAHPDTTLPSEKSIEDLLLNDKEFLDLVENSKAAKLLASSVDKDSREDVIRTGVTSRVIRFIINNFYNKKLTRDGFVDKQDDDDSTSSTGREKSQAASPTTSTGSSTSAKSTLPFDLARLAGIAKRGYDAAMSAGEPKEPPATEPQKPQALPAPQKPDIDLTPDLKQKQQEPARRKKDES